MTTSLEAVSDARTTQRGPSATLWVLRSVLTLHALGAVAQPLLAGRYLAGDFDALAVHAANAGLLILTAMSAIAAGILYWLGGRGAGWPALLLVVLFIAEIAQTAFGALRVLAVHIPLGVGIVAAAVVLAAWSYRPSARRARSQRPARIPEVRR